MLFFSFSFCTVEMLVDWLAGWGMAIFMVSSVGCGFANSFWTLLVCRIIMGAGEASIINLTGKLHQMHW